MNSGWPSHRWATALKLACPPLAGLPLSLVLAVSLSGQPDFDIFPLLSCIAALLAWWRSRGLGEIQPGKPLGSAAILAGFAVLLVVTLLGIQRMSLLWLLAATLAVGWRIGGMPLLRAWAPPLACVLWAIPPPLGWHAWITRQLQSAAVEGCHQVLMAGELLHAVRGLLIALPEHTFFVSEACSGVRSLCAMGAFASLWAVFMTRPAWHAGALVASAIGWVLVVNMARILAIIAGFKLGWNLSDGWPHAALGMAVFGAGIALIGGTDIGLAMLSEWWIGRPRTSPPASEATRWPRVQAWHPWVVSISAAMFILQCAVSTLVVARAVPQWRATAHLPPLAGALAGSIAGWSKVSGPLTVESPGMMALGVRSQQWVYAREGLVAQVAMDDNFPGWHPLDDCYVFGGWIRKETRVLPGSLGPVVACELERDGARHGFLAFGLKANDGRWIAPPEVVERYSVALVNHLKHLYLGQDVSGTESPSRQVQVFVDSTRPLDEAGRATALELFEAVRAAFDPLLWPAGEP